MCVYVKDITGMLYNKNAETHCPYASVFKFAQLVLIISLLFLLLCIHSRTIDKMPETSSNINNKELQVITLKPK